MVGLLELAIYFRAFLTLVASFFKKIYLPLLDGLLLFGGLYWLKDFWASTWFNNPDYYQPSFLQINVPLYIGVWLLSVYLRGGYDRPYRIAPLFSGLAVGSVLLAAIYGFLPMAYRTSRMLLLLGAVWAFIATFSVRALLHFMKNKDFQIGKIPSRKLILVAGKAEGKRVLQLLQQANISQSYIGLVAPQPTRDTAFLSDIAHLKEVVNVYDIEEIIFCSKDISAQAIMQWMTRLGPEINYKIVPADSLSIIGSHSKNTQGELYTVEIQYQIATILQRRNKRLLDILVALSFLLLGPFLLWLIGNKTGFYKNIIQVGIGNKSWVGYYPIEEEKSNLPPIRKGVLCPFEGLDKEGLDKSTIRRLNFLYARNYTWQRDLQLLRKGFRLLGN